MKLETILKITDEYQYRMAKNSRESLCVLISNAVRRMDLENLTDLLESKEIAKTAIEAYHSKGKKQKNFTVEDEVA